MWASTLCGASDIAFSRQSIAAALFSVVRGDFGRRLNSAVEPVLPYRFLNHYQVEARAARPTPRKTSIARDLNLYPSRGKSENRLLQRSPSCFARCSAGANSIAYMVVFRRSGALKSPIELRSKHIPQPKSMVSSQPCNRGRATNHILRSISQESPIAVRTFPGRFEQLADRSFGNIRGRVACRERGRQSSATERRAGSFRSGNSSEHFECCVPDRGAASHQ